MIAVAVVTWTTASITAAFSLCLGVLVLLFGDPVFDVFEGQNLQVYVVATIGVVIALSAAADVLAYRVFRGHRWARWALVVLSAASRLCAATLGYYVAPLVITAAASAVVVLLFLRDVATASIHSVGGIPDLGMTGSAEGSHRTGTARSPRNIVEAEPPRLPLDPWVVVSSPIRATRKRVSRSPGTADRSAGPWPRARCG